MIRDDLPVLKVGRLGSKAELALDFSDDPWFHIRSEIIDHHMGKEPLHRPLTQFKIGYNHEAVFVVFRVIDKFVRATATAYQGPVYKDSCVEFFFSPNPDITHGYFNLEVNCCGQALFEFHPPGGSPMVPIPENVFARIGLLHQLEGTIDPEHELPLVWSVAVRIPVDCLGTFCPATRPEPGVSWRANFHKCADLSSHPHWLTWAKVDYPEPKFHLPEYFGRLEFE